MGVGDPKAISWQSYSFVGADASMGRPAPGDQLFQGHGLCQIGPLERWGPESLYHIFRTPGKNDPGFDQAQIWAGILGPGQNMGPDVGPGPKIDADFGPLMS